MRGYAVDRGRVDHDRQRARLNGGLERREVLFAQFAQRHVCRCAVLTRVGHAVGHEVLGTRRDMTGVDVVGVVALIAQHHLARHFGRQIGILAEALPHARPCGLAAEIHSRRIGPGDVARPDFVGRLLGHVAHHRAVERRRSVDLLREQGRAVRIRSAVNGVDAVERRQPRIAYRDLVDTLDDRVPLLGRERLAGGVEHRTDLVLLHYLLQGLFVQHEGLVAGDTADAVAEHVDTDLGHLTYLLFERHLRKDLFDLSFDARIAGDSRASLPGLRRHRRCCNHCGHKQ